MNEPNKKVRPIAFYLPQFHPTAENDEWWGKGFTEWTNVAKAKPLFKGHSQPHLPADLGFYDLRLAETKQAQAEMAREYGIEGFCYYHYWFHGTRMLDRVVREVLESGAPDFPFCLCWANETWSRRWWGDYGEKEILLEQTYSEEDDLNHIRFLIDVFKDERYIKVNGRPVFLIYRTELIEDRLEKMLDVWNRELAAANVPPLYLCSVRTAPPKGFEASVDFFPGEVLSKVKSRMRQSIEYRTGKLVPSLKAKHTKIDYEKIVELAIKQPYPDYKKFFCPVPSWDNAARRAEMGALMLTDSTPEKFERWLSFCVAETEKRFSGEESLLFINAWNEWAEGCHLEPDQKWQRGYLEAVKNALTR